MKTLVFHTMIMVSRTDRALSTSGSAAGQLFALQRSLDSKKVAYLSLTWHYYITQKLFPGMPVIFSQNLARFIDPPMISDREKLGQIIFEGLGEIHLTECRHLYYRGSHVSQLSRLPLQSSKRSCHFQGMINLTRMQN